MATKLTKEGYPNDTGAVRQRNTGTMSVTPSTVGGFFGCYLNGKP